MNLPMMTDPVRLEQMALVDRLISFCYLTRSPLLACSVFRALHWTFEYGLSKFSPPAFAMTGVILGAVVGDLNGAAVYGKYAMTMLNRLDLASSKAVGSRTGFIVHNLVLHWTQPARSMLKPLLRGYEMGLLSGDTSSANWCINAYIAQSLVSGRNLAVLEEDCQVYCTQMAGMNVVSILNSCSISWQLVLNLMGRDKNTTKLTGRALPEHTHCQESNGFFTSLLNVQESMLCGYFGDHERGAALAIERGNTFQKSNPGSAFSTSDAFHRCLSLLAMVRKRKEGEEGAVDLTRSMEVKYVKSAKEAYGQIKKWAGQGNPNVRHYETLLEAEFAAYGDK